MDLEDPALCLAAGRESWRVGSAVEVFSNSDRRWHIGWVVAEDLAGDLFRVLFDDQSPALKCKILGRDDVKLAPVGTSIHRLPPHCEVVAAGRNVPMLQHQPTGRRCATLEEAWAVHFDVFLRSHVQSSGLQLGSMTARGTSNQTLNCTQPVLRMPGLDASSVDGNTVVCAPPPPFAQGDVDALSSVRQCEGSSPPGHEFELERFKAEVLHLNGLLEERDSLVRSLRSEVKELREEGDLMRQELAEAKLELERYYNGLPPSLSRSLPSVPRSWQPGRQNGGFDAARQPGQMCGAGAKTVTVVMESERNEPSTSGAAHSVQSEKGRPSQTGQTGSARERRCSERPVEIRVSVPRAMTPDELLEERRIASQARSLRSLAPSSLAPTVVRMPSAPHALTSHGNSGGLAVSVAAAASTPARFVANQPSITQSSAVAQGGCPKVLSHRR